MLKRANTWDLQPEVLRRSMSSSQRNENGPAQANGGVKAPYFRYELSPRRWDRLGVSIVAHTIAGATQDSAQNRRDQTAASGGSGEGVSGAGHTKASATAQKRSGGKYV